MVSHCVSSFEIPKLPMLKQLLDLHWDLCFLFFEMPGHAFPLLFSIGLSFFFF